MDWGYLDFARLFLSIYSWDLLRDPKKGSAMKITPHPFFPWGMTTVFGERTSGARHIF
jgi:hypothetical protein